MFRLANRLRQSPAALVRFFDNLSIRKKLFVYGGTLIGLIVGLALYSLYQVTIITTQQIPARVAARDMANALLSMHINDQELIAEAESPSSEFYLKRHSPGFDEWQENYQKLNDSYEKVIQLYNGTGIASDLTIVKPKLEEYQATLLELVSAFQQRGFQSFGRAGALELRAVALEDSVKTNPRAYTTLLKLTRSQRDFYLHPELKDVTDFDTYAAELENYLTTPTDKVLLSEYKTIFKEVVALYEKIGFTATNGLQGKLALAINDISPRILATESEVVALTSDRITNIFQSVFIATAIIIVVGIVMAVGISRLITRRLTQLLEASSRIAAGDFDTRLNATASDELGHLAETFDRMAAQLEKGRATLHERARDLSQSVKRFELASRAVHEAIYEWNITNSKREWGDGLVSEFGYTRKDRQTSIDWWIDRLHPDDAEEVNNTLTRHFDRKASAWQAVYRFRKANGQYVYCQDRGFVEYHHDKPIRMVGSLTDITRQIELERAKDEFISIASHQLRTPLGSIRWNLDLLLEKAAKLPADVRTDIQEAHSSTLRMLGLVGDLLSVARIEQNRVQTMPILSDLSTVVEQAVHEMQPLASQRKITIDLSSLKHTQFETVIDPKQFREVIQNLLSNAVKYTPVKGTVTVNITPEVKKFVVSVSDTGIGIPEDDLHNMFGKFFRAHNVTTSDTEGSGLGLFVVKSYVEKWGGHIWLTSKLNQGTTFYFTVPRKNSVQKPKA